MIALLKYYRWYKFAIIYEDSEVYRILYESLQVEAEKNNFTVTHAKKFVPDYSDNPLPAKIEETFETTRIYIYIGDKRFIFRFLVAIYDKHLHVNGEYMVIYINNEMYDPELAYEYIFTGDSEAHLKRGEKASATKAAQSLLVIAPTPAKELEYNNFLNKVREYNTEPPFSFPAPFNNITKHITVFAAYLYDAVMLYAEALGKILKEKGDPKNGTSVIQHIISKRRYTSISGVEMQFDENGEVEGNYTLLARYPKPHNSNLKGEINMTHIMVPVGVFVIDENTNEIALRHYKDIHWVGGKPPLDEPPCGFDGSICRDKPNKRREIIFGVLVSILITVIVSSIIIYRNWTYEQEIAGLLWCIHLSEIQKCGVGGIMQSSSKTSLVSQMSMESKAVLYAYTQTAMYRGSIVAVKQFQYSRKSIDIPRDTKKEMKLMRELRHDNINSFIGACVQPNCIYILNEYCSKGSLQDVLENDDLKLDNMFIASLVFDLVTGITFIHESDLKIHGNLKSSNCVITSRWVLKVSDFGLHYLRSLADSDFLENEYKYFRSTYLMV